MSSASPIGPALWKRNLLRAPINRTAWQLSAIPFSKSPPPLNRSKTAAVLPCASSAPPSRERFLQRTPPPDPQQKTNYRPSQVREARNVAETSQLLKGSQDLQQNP